MANVLITKRVVDSLEFSHLCDYFVWDSRLKGFGIRVTEHGSEGAVIRRKAFVLGYRIKGSLRYRRFTFGVFGPLTVEHARDEALKLLSEAAQGRDPQDARRSGRNALSMRELGTHWLEDVDRRRKPGTAREYRRLWQKNVLPVFGPRTISSITNVDIRKLHRSLHKTPYVANRVAARLSTFFEYAITEGAILSKENPVRGIEFYPEQGRERFLTKEEFGRLGEALARAEREGLPPAPEYRSKPKKPENQKHRPKSAGIPKPANLFAIAAIRLLALTGCRENEVLSLRWDAVDFERGHLRLDDSKTGKSVRPLGQSAAELLLTLPRVEGNPYVLPGLMSKGHLKETKRVWYAVRHAAKLKGLRLHDLRHSFASVPATSGESLLVVRSLLGHKNVATTERYAHLGDDPVKRVANQTAADISEWMGASVAPDPKVRPIEGSLGG